MRGSRAPLVVVALGVVLTIGVRLHALDDDFPNPDIAGITYNAEVLLHGGLPYVDTLEVKPPGAFWLAAAILAICGRDLLWLQLGHALWLALAAPAVGIVAACACRERAAEDRRLVSATAAAVYLVTASMFSYNYASWMVPAYAWAVAAALQGVRRQSLAWHVLAGAAALLAVATIQRAIVLAVLLPLALVWARRRGVGSRRHAWLGWSIGAAAMLAVFALPYVAGGHVGALLAGIVPIETAMRYGEAAASGGVAVVVGVAAQLARTFWLPCAAIVLAIAADRFARRQPGAIADDTWWIGGAWLAASIAGAAIGGARFYLHYLVQYAPALAVLAAHPAVVAGLARATEPRAMRRVLAAGVALLVGLQVLEIGVGRGHRYESKARRLTGGLTAAQAAGRHIAERTDPGDTIMVWGWTAWPVYWWADRRAPSPVYKPMGTLTTFNVNTEFVAGGTIAFVPGPAADLVIEAFDRAPPAYFVYSPSFVATFGADPDPIEAFGPLVERLATQYRPEAAFGDLVLYRRIEAAGP